MASIDTVFWLNEHEVLLWREIEAYYPLFTFLRPSLIDNKPVQSLMCDFSMIYYLETPPMLDDQVALTYILRKQLTEEVIHHHLFRKIQQVTEGHLVLSILAAAWTVNLFSDLADEMDSSNQVLMAEILSFNNASRQIFEEVFEKYNDYPKYVVEVETKIVKVFRRFIHQFPNEYEERIRKILQFINEYDLNQKDLLHNFD